MIAGKCMLTHLLETVAPIRMRHPFNSDIVISQALCLLGTSSNVLRAP